MRSQKFILSASGKCYQRTLSRNQIETTTSKLEHGLWKLNEDIWMHEREIYDIVSNFILPALYTKTITEFSYVN